MDSPAYGDFAFDTVYLVAPDVQGQLVGRRIPRRRFEARRDEGVRICSIPLSWSSSEEPITTASGWGWNQGWKDIVLRPDGKTLRPYPGLSNVAICLAHVEDQEGQRVAVAPRTILQTQVERARLRGMNMEIASELEFYLLPGTVQDLRAAGFRNLRGPGLVRRFYGVTGHSALEPFFSQLQAEMDRAGIPIVTCEPEYGVNQWEVNLDHCDAIDMADRHVIYRAGIQEIAAQHGLTATFMAKPFTDDLGSSGHFHISLWQGGLSLFADKMRPTELSAAGRRFLGGLMRRMDETALFYAPHVNSYKRHERGVMGGGFHAWGYDNRTVTFRVVGQGQEINLENRYPGADVNPYLAISAMIAAGLDGLDDPSCDPDQPLAGNAYDCVGLRHGPWSLGEAIDNFIESPFTRAQFGQAVVDHFGALCRHEWQDYLRVVTDWELTRGFDGL